MSEEDISSIQAICAVSKERAVELLEAASGVLDRAVDIHLLQQQAGQSSISQARAGASTVLIDEGNVDVVVVEEINSKPSLDPPKKKQRIASGSTKQNSKQNTLHSFLGIEKKKSPAKKSQPTIHSFFKRKETRRSPPEVSHKPDVNPRDGKRERETAVTDNTKITPSLKPATHGKISSSSRANQDESPQEPVDPRLSYATLATAFSAITETAKRNAKLNILKSLIKGCLVALGGISGDEKSRKEDAKTLTNMLELISGKISLEDSDLVTPAPLQVSGAAVSEALRIVIGLSKSNLRDTYRRTGDLGDVAAEFFSPKVSAENFFAPRAKVADQDTSKKTTTTTTTTKTTTCKSASIVEIHRLLQDVASVPKGTGSQKQRHNILVKLLRLAQSKAEMRFLVRILIGNMRLGATMKSVLASLAMAVQEIQTQETTTQDPAIQIVQKTYDICPRLDRIVLSLICGGVEQMVEECSLEVGIPITPSLANPAHSLQEVEQFMMKGASTKEKPYSNSVVADVVAEWKYDGVRGQFHYDAGLGIKQLFSRHLLDNTQQYPDAVQYILGARKGTHVHSFIIDAEIVGIARNKKDGEWRLLPFQILSTRRGTKNNTGVQIRVFAFDLMYLNGESLIKKSLWERQKLLRESFSETVDGFSYAESKGFAFFDESQMTTYLQEAVKGGAEGLMLKLTGRSRTEVIPQPLATPYESGNRSTTWLKLKRDYVAGFADTLDVVPIGAWFGNGRKAEKGFLSPILLAVYDEGDGVFRSITRCMTFTDAMYSAIREFYFRGSNYPADVGLSGDETQKKQAQPEDSKDDDSGSEGECEGDVKVDNENKGQPTEEGTGTASENNNDDDSNNDEVNFVGVNCFPGRPSTSVYITNESPTIWFKPKEVWEVSFADLTLSRMHTAAAGLVDDSECRGVALRFPRFKRRRPDKGVEQATTSIQIAQLFTKQFKQG